MKTYVAITGVLFGLLVVAHIWRVALEGPALGKDPSFIIITLAAAGMSSWAWIVLRAKPRA